MQTIGLVHPGAMGSVVAGSIKNSGYEVLWASENRSDASQERAEEAGLVDVGTLRELCERSAAIVSICPPHAAEDVADAVVAAGYHRFFLDANAISPQRTARMGEKMTAAGITFVDGSIVGGPPREPGQTWLYLSGPEAGEAASFFERGPLETEIIGPEVGKASALKMCFAANTKGTTALLSAILGAAEALGVRDTLEKQWSRRDPGFAEEIHRRVAGTAYSRAWRFVGEMEEMADTFDGAGLPAGYFSAAAETYRRVAHFKNSPGPPDLGSVLAALRKAGSS